MGNIPGAWRQAIIIPILKLVKGEGRNQLINYWSISLLSILSNHLLEKLQSWLIQENILMDKQAGLRERQANMGHHLMIKYTFNKTVSLYAAFMNLKPTSVSLKQKNKTKKNTSSQLASAGSSDHTGDL